jgi:hypothetical protein
MTRKSITQITKMENIKEHFAFAKEEILCLMVPLNERRPPHWSSYQPHLANTKQKCFGYASTNTI